MKAAPLVLYVNAEKRSIIERSKFAGLKRCAGAYGWSADVVWDTRSHPEQLKKVLSRRHPVGCIVECAAGMAGLMPRVFGTIPVVYLDPRETLCGKGFSWVINDGDAIARLAFQELSAGRPDSYAAVGYYRPSSWSDARLVSFARRAKSRSRACPLFTDVGRTRAAALRKWLAGLPEKCAIFAVNDEVAREVATAARKIGRKMPTDLTVIGVDNYEKYCQQGSPTLSSVRIDFELAGFKACELLHRICQGEPSGLHETFGPLLVVRRESTSGFGRHERRVDEAVDLIRREACNGLRARDVVKAMAGSRRLSELRFREALGHSILEEIVTVRLTRVFQMLGDPAVPIEDVVRASGFATGAALRKAFVSRTGLSLSSWRKRYGRAAV